MTIRGIARDLYRLQQEVESLQKQFESAPHAKQVHIYHQLRKVKAQRNRLQRILDGQLDR